MSGHQGVGVSRCQGVRLSGDSRPVQVVLAKYIQNIVRHRRVTKFGQYLVFPGFEGNHAFLGKGDEWIKFITKEKVPMSGPLSILKSPSSPPIKQRYRTN